VKDGSAPDELVSLATIATQWGRLGAIGFGGPPAHIALFRQLCVADTGWLSATEFEDGIAVTNLLPGPGSTQLAVWCGWKLRGARGAMVGGLFFVLPGLSIILVLAALFLSSNPPPALLGVAAGIAAVVPAVALAAAVGLVPASWQRAGTTPGARAWWVAYLAAGALAATLVGQLLVIVLLGCGLVAVVIRRSPSTIRLWVPPLVPATVLPALGEFAAVAWVAFKVGALAYGGGFVIVPLMQHDAVVRYQWMTSGEFLDAVALGQATPGPLAQTVAVVGYAAAGLPGALLAATVVFAPSFVLVIAGARHLDRLRGDAAVQAFLTGAGAAAIGAIGGASVTLGLALSHGWQVPLLVLAAGWLLVLRRSVPPVLLVAGAVGMALVWLGVPPAP
jgi:chromate transporter